ncbi:hypothetical protein ARMGADRAFT_604894 [Armillaria gallica]|uniref:Uncharacterized protein n=1 Tax=Armillaria gallica TaxID=47427 RepID=A0A2H3D6R9_ARMGA|nr:hypothetical protein ARMGADRAFT_604894 [Armillaria gallica]
MAVAGALVSAEHLALWPVSQQVFVSGIVLSELRYRGGGLWEDVTQKLFTGHVGCYEISEIFLMTGKPVSKAGFYTLDVG